jgi:L-threonylcarbamoyladenylate synthase
MNAKTRSFREAKAVLQKGGIVVYPTETAYGVGCDAGNAAAVRALYRVKGRQKKKPFAVIAADLAMVKRFFFLDDTALRLVKHHWPGPLTIVLSTRDARLQKALGRKHIGVRVSSHPVAAALSRAVGAPIVSTSANASGGKNCYSITAVRASLGDRIMDVVVCDGGPLPRRAPSTLVLLRRGIPVVLRQGSVRVKSAVRSE